MQSHEMHNLLRVLKRLGRTIKERVIINSDEVEDGQLTDREVVTSFQDGNFTVEETQYYHTLDCSHLAPVSSIAATCDICGNRVCQSCVSVCSKCQKLICRCCSRIYADEHSEQTLCTSCHWDVKRKDNALKACKSVYGFFVKTKGD
ncbi:hypothetical protein ACFL6S_32115 [Candidatus Poribacteria bacterium]